MKLKIYKRGENFYSVVNVQDKREVAVFNYYKSAMRYVKEESAFSHSLSIKFRAISITG